MVAVEDPSVWNNTELVSGIDLMKDSGRYIDAFLRAPPGTWTFPQVGTIPWSECGKVRGEEGKFYCQEPMCEYKAHVLLSRLK